LEYGVLNSEKKQLALESLWRPVLASSAGERPNAICITFFPARNILEQKMRQLSNMWELRLMSILKSSASIMPLYQEQCVPGVEYVVYITKFVETYEVWSS
jgi:hypothetical protein